MHQVTVRVPVRRELYTIIIGTGVIKRLASVIAHKRFGKRYVIITDSKVRPLYGERLRDSIAETGFDAALLDFPEGELYKTHETKLSLDMQLLGLGLGRDSAVIALGGGVVGDVAGFVASTYMRGIPCIQVPTTVVAQADSSIGGKTAVDYPLGKNLIGTFHYPVAVFIDPETLVTLDDRNYRSGLIEMIKHGLVRDSSFFEYFVRQADAILSRNHPDYGLVMTELMTRNSKIKNEIVSRDPREKNLRKILNYGHTIGHAVEHLSGYSLLHGEAVAIGIACEAFFSKKLGICGETDYESQVRLISSLGLPVAIPANITTESIIETMHTDKKAIGKQAQFVLLRKIGRVKKGDRGSMVHGITDAKLGELIADFRAIT